MTITTYEELKVAVQDYSKRSDILSLVDTFIDIAESAMYSNPDCNLRAQQMEHRATGSTSITTRYVAFPTRYLEMRQVKLNLTEGDYILEARTPESMSISSAAGIPTQFCMTNQVELNCISDAVYTIEFLHYRRLAPLTAAAPTNDILTNYPQVYLYGALFALYQWSLQPDMEQKYYNAFIKAIQGVNNQSRRGRYHQPAIRSRERMP